MKIERRENPEKGPACVLLADDDIVTLRVVDRQLRNAGFDTKLAHDGEEALDRLDESVRIAIFDLQMPKLGGLECLRKARERYPDLPVLIISQVGEIKDAVQAMKHGAFEFIRKPVEPDELLARIRQAERSIELVNENNQLRQAVTTPAIATDVIGSSEFAHWLTERAKRIAQLDSTLLLTGESGTGKTTVARMIHHLGGRASGPFIAVSCAALPRDLIEAELFGHVKGAFTGAIGDRPGRAEMADGGTLFLDEIGDLPLELQPKLLTFLQDRTLQRIGGQATRAVDVRIIAATNHDLEAKAKTGEFRQDLYFRLAVLTLAMKPLRDRPKDIDAFAEHILEQIAQRRKEAIYRLNADAKSALRQYSWPGNIRELENVLERASAFCEKGTITPADLALLPASPATSTSGTSSQLAGLTLADIEKRAIIETLAASGGNKKAAARSLGIDEKSIYNKMKRLGLMPPEG